MTTSSWQTKRRGLARRDAGLAVCYAQSNVAAVTGKLSKLNDEHTSSDKAFSKPSGFRENASLYRSFFTNPIFSKPLRLIASARSKTTEASTAPSSTRTRNLSRPRSPRACTRPRGPSRSRKSLPPRVGSSPKPTWRRKLLPCTDRREVLALPAEGITLKPRRHGSLRGKKVDPSRNLARPTEAPESSPMDAGTASDDGCVPTELSGRGAPRRDVLQDRDSLTPRSRGGGGGWAS